MSDIRIRYYREADDSMQDDEYETVWEKPWPDDGDGSRTAVYDSEEDIETLLPALVYYDYRNMNDYYDMKAPDNVDVYVTADFDTGSSFNDRGGRSGGFMLNLKKLSPEDAKRFGLAQNTISD